MKELYLNSLYRLRKNTLFYVVFGLVIAVGIIVNIVLFTEINYISSMYSWDMSSYENVFSLNSIFLTTYSPASLPMLLIPVFSIFFISEDYRNDTFRNQILSGKTRKQIFFSSLLLCLSLYLLGVILALIFGLLIGVCIPYLNVTVSAGEFILDLWVCFLVGIMINCFACFIANSFSNTAISIIVFLAIIFAFNSIPVLSGFNYLFFGGNNVISTYIYDEFLYPTQLNRAIAGTLDKAYLYAIGEYSFFASATTLVEGRTVFIVLKNFFMSALEIGLFIFFGLHNFEHKDLR